jgi:hypothetical protein
MIIIRPNKYNIEINYIYTWIPGIPVVIIINNKPGGPKRKKEKNRT